MKLIKKIMSVLVAGVCACTCMSSAIATDLSSWALDDYNAANASGLLSFDIVSSNMKKNITREEFCDLAVTLYQNLTHETISLSAPNPFDDVDNINVTNAFYYGIAAGVSDNEFMPDKLVTRQEMALMLLRTITSAERPVSVVSDDDFNNVCKFTDNYKIADWAKSSIATMVSYDIMRGMNGNEFVPQGNSTMEQAIISINRIYKNFASSKSDYEIPVVTSPIAGTTIDTWQFSVKWSSVSDVDSYYIIVKDQNANVVYRANIAETEAIFSYNILANAKYSVIVGAKFNDGFETFSSPVDFTYNYVSEEQKKAAAAAAAKESTPVPIAGTEKEQAVLNEAAKYLGIPYLWGGNSPAEGGMDCSGFVKYVYTNLGYSLYRVADDQYKKNGTYVPRDQLRPGDLVFFGSGNYASHVGMYVGKVNGVDTMIHAPSTGKVIQYASIEQSYFASRYLGAKRILK